MYFSLSRVLKAVGTSTRSGISFTTAGALKKVIASTEEARNGALSQVQEIARQRGANAILGLTFDLEPSENPDFPYSLITCTAQGNLSCY